MIRFLLPLCLLGLLILPLGGCRRDTVEVGKEETLGSESFKVIMPKHGEVSDPEHGKGIWFAIGPVTGVEGTPANGVVQAHFFEDGTFLLGLQINIEKPKDGFFYEGWLEGVDPGKRVSVGHLQSTFGDVRHHLRFKDALDLRPYRKVLVTLEVDDGNPDPGERVAEAVLQARQRN